MMELMIGRESGAEKPRLAIIKDGATSFYGQPGSVPRSVSRAHCRITVRDDLTMDIEDVTPNNFMFVNGVDCKKRHDVKLEDVVELGPDHYRLDLETIVKSYASKQEWRIRNLKGIYQDYNQAKLDNQVKQGRLGAFSALPGILSMASIGLAFYLPEARVSMIVMAAILALVFFLFRFVNAGRNPAEMRKLDDKFREQYVCPNPACKHFLGAVPYKELLKNKTCPYCKARFIE